VRKQSLVPLAILLFSWELTAQEAPSVFELFLPDFFETSFAGTKTLIELPDRPIRRLNILVRDAQKRNINPGRYRISVNGKGLGNVFEERTTLDGALLVMDPETLRRRPDELFDSRENAVEIVAEDRRGRVYYQNWILRVNDAQRNALFGYSSSVSPEDPRAVPPDLIVTEPTVPPRLKGNETSAKVVLKGHISAEATLRVNGQTVVSAASAGGANFEYVANVAREQHELVLDAVDAKAGSRRVVIPVFGGPRASPQARFVGQKYAVLIGVSRFGTTKDAVPPLPLSSADVNELARTLKEKAGFRPENIRVLTDEGATIEQVRVALSDFASKPQANDLLLLYIATHGMHDPRPNREGMLYLALYGTQIATIDSTALPLSDLEILLNRSVRTDQCFLVFDVGHELNEEWRFRAGLSLVNNHVLNLFRDKAPWSVLVSGSSGQVSGGQRGSGTISSVFSYWLSQGFGGAADLDGDGVVTAKELFGFVSEKVNEESQGNQQPRFRLSAQAGQQPLGTK
jgi:hypothetical protein